MSAYMGPIVAFDPASINFGWSLVDEGPRYIASGVWHIPATAPPDVRVIKAGCAVPDTVRRCCENGWTRMALLFEVPDFIADRAKLHIVTYFLAVGAALYAAHLTGLQIFRVTASKDKREIRKKEGRERFYRATGRYAETDDESDAFCIGWDYQLELMKAAEAATPAKTPADLS